MYEALTDMHCNATVFEYNTAASMTTSLVCSPSECKMIPEHNPYMQPVKLVFYTNGKNHL